MTTAPPSSHPHRFGWVSDQPYLLLSLTSLFWAGNAIVGRLAAGHFPPVTLSFLRWSCAFLIVLPFAWRHLRQDWRESAQLLGAGTWDFWRHIGLPVLTPALLGTFVILLANALGAYAPVYYLTTGNFNVMPIRIAGLVAGDISLDPNLASALAMVLVGLMALITVVHQWLLRRSYHDAR